METSLVISLVVVVIFTLRVVLTWFMAHAYDKAEARRAAFPPGRNVHPNLLSERMVNDSNFQHQEGFFEGLWWQKLWISHTEPKGVIVMFHGYADHCDFLQLTHAHELALRTSCVVFIFDQPGFGRSQGLWGFIPSWTAHVDKCMRFITEFVRPFAKRLKVFGVGGSMGGGVLLTVAISRKDVLDGMILLAPMCEIAASLRPAYSVELILRAFALLVPELPVTPSPDLSALCYRESDFAEIMLSRNHLNYKMKPRLGTALSLVEAQEFIAANMEKVQTPFLVIHGTSDRITNPNSSKKLHDRASAKDKSIVLLKDYHHCLMGGGQNSDLCEIPYSLISAWITSRT